MGLNAAPNLPVPAGFDPERIRAEFPLLRRLVHGKPLVYLDNANTAQKPEAVLAAMDRYYREYNANVARAVHALSEEATLEYEQARRTIADFIHARRPEEVVLTRGTTEALNLVAYSHARSTLCRGDVIALSVMEHHANIVPWQLIAQEVGARLQVIPIDPRGALDLEALDRMLHEPVKILALTHVSNVLGTINPIQEICRWARRRGVVTVIDGSQALPHFPIDVQALDCDFYAGTGHKLFGPTGTGFLYGRYALLDAMPPFLGGGEMIDRVDFAGTTFNSPPYRFEAGTPNIAGQIGLAAALRWLRQQDAQAVQEHERALLEHASERLAAIPGLRLIGQAAEKVPLLCFVIEGTHANDVALLLDQEGIAVRSGQHCAHPLLRQLGVGATVRASFALYNTRDEIERFATALERVRRMLV